MIRVAAVGDLHFGGDAQGSWATHAEHLVEQADVLLLAGDLTRIGAPAEAETLAEELAGVASSIPVLAVLGNHDHHSGSPDKVAATLERSGVQVLDGDAAIVHVHGSTLGVAGTIGFGGGFAGACASDFGEPQMKAFVEHTKDQAATLEASLSSLRTDRRVALLHYSPIEGTLHGERLEVYPFLGSYLLAEAVDHGGADLVVHGHAHNGVEKGATPGGVHVRNVAQPVLRRSYRVYCLE